MAREARTGSLGGPCQTLLWRWSGSLPAVGQRVVATFPPALLPHLSCWMLQWLVLPRERCGCAAAATAPGTHSLAALCRGASGRRCSFSAKPMHLAVALCREWGRTAGHGRALPGGVCALSRHLGGCPDRRAVHLALSPRNTGPCRVRSPAQSFVLTRSVGRRRESGFVQLAWTLRKKFC